MKKKLSFRPTAPSLAVASEMKLPGTRENLVDSKGQFNAHDNKQLMQIVSGLMSLAEQGNQVVATTEEAEQHMTNREMVQAAFDSHEELVALGEVLAEDIQITSSREGFMRRFLARQDLEQGQIPQARMNKKNTAAVVAVGPTQTQTQYVRDNFFYPREFYITARPYIEQRDIARSTGDILEEKYTDSLEAVMVTEDRTFKALADATINIANPITNIAGTMSPLALGSLTSQVTQWGIPAKHWLIASDLWADIIGDPEFTASFQTTSYAEELVRSGRLGSIFGLEVSSDQFRHEAHKVLGRGEQYIFGSPEMLGQYTDRGGLEAQAIDGTQEKIPGRGWWMSELVSILIANPRAVAKAVRI